MSSSKDNKSLSNKYNNDDDKKSSGGSGGVGGSQLMMIVMFPIVSFAWFAVGSWQLSLLLDQIKCSAKSKKSGAHASKKGGSGGAVAPAQAAPSTGAVPKHALCLLPSNRCNYPYSTPGACQKAASGPFNAVLPAFYALSDSFKLKILSIFGIKGHDKNKKVKRHPVPTSGGGRRKNMKGGGGKINPDILEILNVEGFKPFNLFTGPVQFPYSWADETSFLNFKSWYANMQITSWSMGRGILSGYLKIFRAFINTKSKTVNYWTRLLMSMALPAILGLALAAAPLVSLLTSIYGMFKGSHSLICGLVFFFIPIFTIITMHFQMFQLLAYFLIGGLLGSGQEQVAQNFATYGHGGYLGIIQTLGVIICLGTLTILVFLLFAAAKQKKDTTTDKTDSSKDDAKH